MKRKKRKLMIGVSAVLLICATISFISMFTSEAALVDVYKTEKPELEFVNIYGELCNGYQPSATKSKMNRQENGVYRMQTNAWAMWSPNDSVSYAYTKSAFHAGKETVMTIRFSIDEWEGKEIGIAVRKSLEPGSECMLASLRESEGYFLIRKELNSDYSYTKVAASTVFGGAEQMHMKLVISKEKCRVNAYYKKGGSLDDETGWSSIGTKTAGFLGDCLELYTGIAISTADENKTANAVCSNFSVHVQAPEGYQLETGTPEDDGEDTDNKEEDIELPADLAAAGDALLYETFTDGTLFPEQDESLTNPLWTVRSGTPRIEVDDVKKNRYLKVESADETLMLTAGDMEWTDYSAQVDFMFYDETLDNEANKVALLFRHISAVIGGSADYYAVITNKIDADGAFAGQYLQLRYRGCQNTFVPGSTTLLSEVCISNKAMLEKNKTHTMKVHVVDNVIDVYVDDMGTPVLSYTDTNPGTDSKTDPHLHGCIGVLIQEATVGIDNILVRKLQDPLGGDYDNDIMGNYNEPIPEWIEERYGYTSK